MRKPDPTSLLRLVLAAWNDLAGRPDLVLVLAIIAVIVAMVCLTVVVWLLA
ncbi:MAG: hypothetical protein JJT89_07230 [Nitriliruptoraceae bacterium]|nr:hypothetical protein [Nitriliruptoraceae bacterium]